ncbi:hypothetical protein Pmar_PMAR027615 [Perkinsus marinus ATCC 50983]|uniref:NAD-dependent epimerase/dehydratase domain-containing protein n=1 Tax=Perkinsus marinus (strain ATCC 50983 / TXsc) TaxID=423536 RepID=C5KC86_PERM5|nr:hypothetical protein Pmar_PMAR027615 [Perkinsus marinus ATCC 50983]EER17899.1 hypothetical protein Pmar_PMAR027615 [Perkinsus marinus ATCC 50983]|eukprot:XP_002786103.1 hypothetical protein Pmar_PMAR027615 [Perkinsus marinus ATCC 50983]
MSSPLYREYTAVLIGGTGRLGSHLVRSFLLSPLCSRLVSIGRPGHAERLNNFITTKMGNAGAKSKLKTIDIAEDLSDLPAALKEYGTGAELAVSALGARGGRYGSASPADLFRLDVATNLSFAETAAQQLGASHVALMSHVSANYSNKTTSDDAMPGNFREAKGLLEYRIETSEVLKSLGTRVSLFKPALITGEPSDQCEAPPAVSTSSSSSVKERLIQALYPIKAQFMRTQYREISADHLALAVRINHEMCVPSEGVSMEPLGYEECMRLIGKDDDI